MERAKRVRKIWFWVLLSTAISGVASIPGIVLFAIHRYFLLMALCILLTAHAFYGVTFYAIAMANAARDLRILRAIDSYELSDVSELAAATGMESGYARTSVERCIKRGYLPGYLFDGSTLERIMPLERRCSYCGRIISVKEVECPGCGARSVE